MAQINKVNRYSRSSAARAEGSLTLSHQFAAPGSATFSGFPGSITAIVDMDHKLVMSYDEARRLAWFIQEQIGLGPKS